MSASDSPKLADFVNQHMGDDIVERFIVLGPVVDDRTAVEPNQIGQPGNVILALERQARALEQSQQIIFTVGFHLVQHLVGREILDADDEAFAQAPETPGQARKHLVRPSFHVSQRGGFGGGLAFHRESRVFCGPGRLAVDAAAAIGDRSRGAGVIGAQPWMSG